jgi:hypothetical protein
VSLATALAVPEARLAGPARLATGAAAALVIAVLGARLADPGEWLLRWPGFSAAALAAAAAGLLADPSPAVAAAAPAPLPLRRALRLAAGLAVPALAWVAVLALATTDLVAGDPPFGPAERGALTIQAAALVLSALGVEALLAPRGGAALAAMTAPVLVVVAAILLPPGLALLTPPGDPAWGGAQVRWAALAAVGAAALVWASRRD